jgi:hypothetical protein
VPEVPEATVLPMQVQQMAMLAGRVETLRSAQSLPRTVAVAVAMVLVLLQEVLAAPAVASGQKGRRPILRERTALVVGPAVVRPLVSML